MEDGLSLDPGRSVQQVVVQELRLDPELALNQLLITVEQIVLVMIRRHRIVILNPVQVWRIFFEKKGKVKVGSLCSGEDVTLSFF